MPLILISTLSAYSSDFRVKDRSRASKGFEGIAHYRDLFWNNKKIAKGVEQVFISPSGRRVLFRQDGELLVADEARHQICTLKDNDPSIPANIVWDEDRSKAQVTYTGKSAAETINLHKISRCRRFQ